MILQLLVYFLDSFSVRRNGTKIPLQDYELLFSRKRASGESYQYFINTLYKGLFFKGYRNLFDFSSEWGGQFGDFYPNVLALRETAIDRVDDSLGNVF